MILHWTSENCRDDTSEMCDESDDQRIGTSPDSKISFQLAVAVGHDPSLRWPTQCYTWISLESYALRLYFIRNKEEYIKPKKWQVWTSEHPTRTLIDVPMASIKNSNNILSRSVSPTSTLPIDVKNPSTADQSTTTSEAKLKQAFKTYAKILSAGTFLVIILIFGVLSIYWGSLYKIPARNMQGWLIVSWQFAFACFEY